MEITKVVKRFVENKELSYRSGCYVLEDPKHKIYKTLNKSEEVRNMEMLKEFTENPKTYKIKIPEIEIKTKRQFGESDIVRRIESVTFFKYVTNMKEFMHLRLYPSDEKILSESIRYVKSLALNLGEISERHLPESTNKEQREYTKKYRKEGLLEI